MSKQTDFRLWTDEEYGFVMESELPARLIAEELGRTRQSVNHVRAKLRRGWVPARTGPEWKSDEEDYLLESMALPVAEVAARLGRTPLAIQHRRMALKKAGRIPRIPGKNYSPFGVGSRTLLARTCIECGLLLEAKWFPVDGRRKSRTKSCRRCMPSYHYPAGEGSREKSREYAEKMQKLTLPGATNNGQLWLEADMKVLSDPSMTILEKALALNRSYHSTTQAARKNGFSSKSRSLGDPAEQQWLIDNPNADKFDEITAGLYPVRELVDAGSQRPPRPNFDWDD